MIVHKGKRKIYYNSLPLADQHRLIHCRTTGPVLGQVMGQLWYCPRAVLQIPRPSTGSVVRQRVKQC